MKKNKYFLLAVVCILTATFSSYKYKRFLKKHPDDPYVTIIGPVLMSDGIGRQTAELAHALMDDFKVNIIARKIDYRDVPGKVKKIVKKKNKALGKVVIFEEPIWTPGNNDINKSISNIKSEEDPRIKIAYSMIEATRIPQEWVICLNYYFDAVAVPDKFLIEVYQRSGVTIPIFELPLGLDIDDLLNKPLKSKKNSPFVFANFSTCIDRKNQIMLVKAFAAAFGDSKDVVLRINCRYGEEPTTSELKAEIANLNLPNIFLSELILPKDAYVKFFEEVDCYVSLSKAEGFSIQPREAMALGIPVIATDNTGQSTICKTNLVKSVKSDVLEKAFYFKGKTPSGYRFNCNLEETIAALKDAYNHYDEYLKKGSSARQWAAQYSFANPSLKKMYKSLISPKNVAFGTENKITVDGICTNSQELYQKYLKITENN